MSAAARAFAALAAVLTLAAVAAPAVHAARGQSLSLTAGLSSFYDDNFLQYSDGQLRDFDQSLHPDRYAIRTRDDLVVNPSLSLGWELDRGHGRRHALRLKGEGDFHDRNGNADFHSLSVGWREFWSRNRRLSASYYVLPRYYLRQLFDDDFVPAFPGLSKYRRADFSLQIASAAWTQRLTRSVLVDLGYQYEHRDYNHEFDERDSRLHQGQVGLHFVRLPRRGSLSLDGGYRVSRARAEDADLAEPVPDPDVSFHGLNLGVGGRMEFARSGAWRLLGDLGYALETRTYDSNRPTDKYHFGRHDLLNAVEIGLRSAYRPHWSLRAYDRLEHNTATLGAAAPLSADAGSYHANQVGLALEWTGGLWTQAGAAPEEETEGPP